MKMLATFYTLAGVALGLCFVFEGEKCRTCQVAAETQCIFQGNTRPCYTSLNSCCTANHASFAVGGCIYETCNLYAAITEEFTNEKCRKMCMAGESETNEFATNCSYEHFDYDDTGKSVLLRPEDCYDYFVHGWSIVGPYAGRVLYEIESPALCQTECQKDPTCERFMWTSIKVDLTEYDLPFRCVLKAANEVDGAYEETWTAEGETIHSTRGMCDPKAKDLCILKGRKCLQCNGENITRCVWPSLAHVAGNKHCANRTICRPAEPIRFDHETGRK